MTVNGSQQIGGARGVHALQWPRPRGWQFGRSAGRISRHWPLARSFFFFISTDVFGSGYHRDWRAVPERLL